MSTDTFYIAQNDLATSIARVLTAGSPAAPIDLTDATAVEFQMADLSGTLVASGACTIVDAPGGEVRYDWADGDTATHGQFRGRFVITFPGDRPQTVPNYSHIMVMISAAFVAPA